MDERLAGPGVLVRVDLELRATLPDTAPAVIAFLDLLERAGGELRAELHYRLGEHLVGFYVCARPEEAALALRDAGASVETATVLTVEMDHRPGAFRNLLATLAGEGIAVQYAYSAASTGRVLAVIRTDDNPRAEDAVRRFLELAEPPSSRSPAGGAVSGRRPGAHQASS